MLWDMHLCVFDVRLSFENRVVSDIDLSDLPHGEARIRTPCKSFLAIQVLCLIASTIDHCRKKNVFSVGYLALVIIVPRTFYR